MARKIKAKLVLQLRNQGLSGRLIASAQGIARNSVQAVLDSADRRVLGWDSGAEMSEAEVHAAAFPGRGVHESVFAQPDWVRIHTELARVGVTLKFLHQEYVDATLLAQATMSYASVDDAHYRFCGPRSNASRHVSSQAPNDYKSVKLTSRCGGHRAHESSRSRSRP